MRTNINGLKLFFKFSFYNLKNVLPSINSHKNIKIEYKFIIRLDLKIIVDLKLK